MFEGQLQEELSKITLKKEEQQEEQQVEAIPLVKPIQDDEINKIPDITKEVEEKLISNAHKEKQAKPIELEQIENVQNHQENFTISDTNSNNIFFIIFGVILVVFAVIAYFVFKDTTNDTLTNEPNNEQGGGNVWG